MQWLPPYGPKNVKVVYSSDLPILAVESGMGESILILTFVVIVIGGIGSVRGALIAALLVGLVDTLGGAYLPTLLRLFLPVAEADGIGASVASMSVYILMAIILAWRPQGLFPARRDHDLRAGLCQPAGNR